MQSHTWRHLPIDTALHQTSKHDLRRTQLFMDTSRSKFNAQLPDAITHILGTCGARGVENRSTKSIHRGSAGAYHEPYQAVWIGLTL